MENSNLRHMELKNQYDQERDAEAFLYEIDRINDFYFTFAYFRHGYYQVYKEAQFARAKRKQSFFLLLLTAQFLRSFVFMVAVCLH